MDILHAMSAALIKYETIDTDQIDQLMERKEVSPPKDWSDPDSGSGASASGSEDTSGKKESSAKEDKGDGSIGGPASLH
jgi:cell division protease FtsH